MSSDGCRVAGQQRAADGGEGVFEIGVFVLERFEGGGEFFYFCPTALDFAEKGLDLLLGGVLE